MLVNQNNQQVTLRHVNSYGVKYSHVYNEYIDMEKPQSQKLPKQYAQLRQGLREQQIPSHPTHGKMFQMIERLNQSSIAVLLDVVQTNELRKVS